MKRAHLPFGVLCICFLAACGGGSEDKVRHFGAGTIAAYAGEELTGSPYWGCLAALAAGALKEHVDRNRGGTFDTDDLLSTVAGCSVTLVF